MRASKYRTEYCRKCIEAGEAGYSLTGFAGMIGVCRRTLNNWMDKHPAFADAVGVHKATRAKFWEDQLSRIARDGGKTGSATMVMFALRNVAPEEYAARHEPDDKPDPGRDRQDPELSDDSKDKLRRIME